MLRSLRLTIGVAVFAILAVRGAYTVSYLVRAYLADGPNTVGEAGKVYFASQIQEGGAAFQDGLTRPYYPSVHGALTHWLVAFIADGSEGETESLYSFGRFVSVLLTVVALALLGDVGRRLGISDLYLVGGLLLWVGSFHIVQHTVSFRPDNWLLFLGALGCWILIVHPDSRRSLIALALLPTLAFHVKMPGAALGGAVMGTMILRGRWRSGLTLGAIQAGLLLGSIWMLNQLSEGAYLAGLRSAAAVEFRPLNAVYSLLYSLVVSWDALPLTILIFPLVWVWRFSNGGLDAARHSAVSPLLVFWAVTGAVYGWAAFRSGSNTYYFLEPATYGLLSGLMWLERADVSGQSNSQQHTVSPPFLAVGLMVTLLALPTVVSFVQKGHPVDVALDRTERLSSVRKQVAEEINTSDLYCYSDDPGLNVLLERPAVIYPLLQLQMINAGTLSKRTLYEPVERKGFDCVVFSGMTFIYQGLPALPQSFFSTVENNYPLTTSVGEYEIRYPESH